MGAQTLPLAAPISRNGSRLSHSEGELSSWGSWEAEDAGRRDSMGLVFRVDATPPEVLTAFLLFPEAGLGDKPGSRAEGFSTAAHLV